MDEENVRVDGEGEEARGDGSPRRSSWSSSSSPSSSDSPARNWRVERVEEVDGTSWVGVRKSSERVAERRRARGGGVTGRGMAVNVVWLAAKTSCAYGLRPMFFIDRNALDAHDSDRVFGSSSSSWGFRLPSLTTSTISESSPMSLSPRLGITTVGIADRSKTGADSPLGKCARASSRDAQSGRESSSGSRGSSSNTR